MRTTHRRYLAATALVGAALILAGCAGQGTSAAPPTTTKPTASASAPADTNSTVATVPGYDVGQFPPVPLFTMPDISMLDASLAGFSIDLDKKVTPRPGLDIRPAACGDMTARATARGTALLYGDGSGTFTGPNGTVVNYGDGSGSWTVNGVTANVYGDGSGSFESPTMKIWNYGDGSGSVETATSKVFVYGDGSASDEGNGVKLWNYGDGSSSYEDGTIEINNYGDGSGSYKAPGISIMNYGDGTATVNDQTVKVAPIPKDAPVGVFPPLGAIAPITSCGTTITLEDGVLFDFDRADIRPDAAAVLDELAAALTELNVPIAEIGGHTDAIGDDDYNQTLSEKRAAAVVAALKDRGVKTSMTAKGYGESVPVAANEVDGHDNPAGRQLNRRVEIFIPAF